MVIPPECFPYINQSAGSRLLSGRPALHLGEKMCIKVKCRIKKVHLHHNECSPDIHKRDKQTQICWSSLSCPLAAAHARPPGRLLVFTAQPRGSLSPRFPILATWMLPLKVPGVQHVRGAMKTPVKWQSKASTSASRGCLSSAALMWWALFAAWCGGAVRLVGPSRLCLLVCWAWQSLWWSQDKQKGYHLLSARPNSSFIYKQRGIGRCHKKKYVSLQPSSERGGTDHLIISVAGYIQNAA